MKSKRMVLILICCVLITLVGCSNKSSSTSSSSASSSVSSASSSSSSTTVEPVKTKLTAQSIFDKLKETESANITATKIITAENDDNKFLGRPNQYTEKINWSDSRAKDSQTECSIELFNNKEDAAARKTYLEGVIKSMPTFTQYIVQKDNVLLRIEGALTPDQSNEYINVFNAIK